MIPNNIVKTGMRFFSRRFGGKASFAAFAPGRANFIGEHTDYTDGLCMPFAVDRHLLVLAAKNDTAHTIRLSSTHVDTSADVRLDEGKLEPSSDWSTYIRGVVQELRDVGIEAPPLDILVHSTLPGGAGLSSSAALEVATIHVVLASLGRELPGEDIMLIAQRAEHRFAGVPCGLLDQFSVVAGRANKLLLFDSRDKTGEPVHMADTALSMVIVNSMVAHSLVDGEYAERREQCEAVEKQLGKSLRDATLADLDAHVASPLLNRRGRHIITENQRVLDMRDALARGDRQRIGALLFEGHASLRDDYETSCAETDLLVALASNLTASGVIGARMTGGGFGGSVLVVADSDQAANVGEILCERYDEATGLQTEALIVTPADGAGVLTLGDQT
ncbi:MAG: galactokinase [Pseudomonadota bacterium]